MTVHLVGPHELAYDDWVLVLDALEPNATTEQRDAAQDALQRNAPRLWLEDLEQRDSRPEAMTP